MLSAKSILTASFVMFCLIQIQCGRVNNALSNELIDRDDKSEIEELNPKYIEVVDIVSEELSSTEDTTEDYSKCYCDSREECLRKCLEDDQRSFEAMFLLTANEVILGTAIIMGLSALVTVLLRICSRPGYAGNSQNISNVPDEFGRTGIRISLTSLQQRVMSKLRDRPPRYETRHNYEYQQRDRTTRIPVLNPGAVPLPVATSMSSNIPPPAYDTSDNVSVHELPPAYTIAIEDTGGILNQSFSSDETPTSNVVESANSESDITNRNRTSDSILHI